MSIFPLIEATSLNGEEKTFPLQKPCTLLIGFDKLHHVTLSEWFESSDNKESDIYIVPLLSDRFSLMKEVLLEGLSSFFKDKRDHVYPAFVNRVQFFGSTGLTEDKPAILRLMPDGSFKVIESL